MTPGDDAARAAANAIRAQWKRRPRAGIILGTGLSGLAREVDVDAEFPCSSLPRLPRATAPGHRGAFVCGLLGGVPTVVLCGRFHGYEGHPPEMIGLPVRVMAELGATVLMVTSAAGGMHPDYRTGDVVILDDHINLTFGNPLIGQQAGEPSRRHVDLSAPYDAELAEQAAAVARRADFVAHRGVYVGVLGPNYETRAEYRMFRRLGGDVVGMSTVYEVIVARQCGLRVLGLSVVTNECRPDALARAESGAVERAAAAAEAKVAAIVRAMVAAL